ncbi:DUF3969 family protein [Staphylococcus aureus]
MITFENIQQLEKYTLMTMHGLFNQLKLGIISIDNAEHTLFTISALETLSSLGVKPDIINLIHKGTELKTLQHLIYQFDKYSYSLFTKN